MILPAELHGLVCGLCAGNPERFALQEFIDLAGADALTDETAVHEFIRGALDDFTSPDMTFTPLIGDDEDELSARLGRLTDWCAGFLSGFGAGAAGESDSALPVEVQEIVRDFARISGLDDDVDGDEEDEVSFMEIHEYVRVGAVLVLTLMAEAGDSA